MEKWFCMGNIVATFDKFLAKAEKTGQPPVLIECITANIKPKLEGSRVA